MRHPEMIRAILAVRVDVLIGRIRVFEMRVSFEACYAVHTVLPGVLIRSLKNAFR